MANDNDFLRTFFGDEPELLEVAQGVGGRRRGAGRKPGSKNKPKIWVLDAGTDEEVESYDKARRRKESALADKEEALAKQNILDYEIKVGNFIPRAAVIQANATAFSTLAQALRSIPDNLERKGFTTKLVQLVSAEIDAALDDLANTLERMKKVSDV